MDLSRGSLAINMFNKINLRVLRAELLRDPNFVLKMDPYCVIRTSRAETRTSVAPSGGKHPVWNESFNLDVTGDNSIYLALYDQETIGKDNAIAEAFVNLNQLQNASGVTARAFPLTYKGQNAGQIFLEFSTGGSNRNLNLNTGAIAQPLPLATPGFVVAPLSPNSQAQLNQAQLLQAQQLHAQQLQAQQAMLNSQAYANANLNAGASNLPLPLVHSVGGSNVGFVERPLTTGERLDIAGQQLNSNLQNTTNKVENAFDRTAAKIADKLDPNPGLNANTAIAYPTGLPPARENVAYQRDLNTGLTAAPVGTVGYAEPTTGQKLKAGLSNLGNKIEQKYEETKAKLADKLDRSRTPSLERDRRNLAQNNNLDINVNPNVDLRPNLAYAQPNLANSNLQYATPVVNTGLVLPPANPGLMQAPVTVVDNRMDRSRERIGNQVRATGADIDYKLQQGANDLGRDIRNLPANVANRVEQTAYNAQVGMQNLGNQIRDRSRELTDPHYNANLHNANYGVGLAAPLTTDARLDRSRERIGNSNINLPMAQGAHIQQAIVVDPMSAEFQSSLAYRQLFGKLIVKIVRAEVTRNPNLIAKMDPYCMVRTKTAELRTHVAEKAGKTPVWNSIFDIELRGDTSIYLGVWDRETFTSDDIVADVTVDLRGNMKNDHRYSGWQTLYYKGEHAGRLFIELEYYPSSNGTNLPVMPGPGNTYVNVNRDQFNNMPAPAH